MRSFLLVIFLVCTCNSLAAIAKIDGDINLFCDQTKRLYSLKARSPYALNKSANNKSSAVHYIFELNANPTQEQASPGFAGGLTVSTVNGRIIGESLLIRLGEKEAGKLMAVALCLDVTYEALGKLVPKQNQDREAEFQLYLRLLNKALAGSPQNIRYHGFPIKITISRTKPTEALLTITKS